MKKKWKVFWITCAVSGIIGTAFLLAAFSMGMTWQQIENVMPGRLSIAGFEEVEPDGNDTTIETYDNYNSSALYEGINALDIELTAGKVEILTTDNSEVEIVTENISKKLNLTYYRQGNTLVVDTGDELKGIVNQKLGTVFIYLPEDMLLEEAKISVGAGTLYVENITVSDFSVEVGAGEADVASFMAEEADIHCGAGEIVLCGYVDEKINIECGMGNVRYNTADNETNYNYKLSCGVGRIECGSHSYSGIGSEQKVDNHAPKQMNIDCGIGEVTVGFNGF